MKSVVFQVFHRIMCCWNDTKWSVSEITVFYIATLVPWQYEQVCHIFSILFPTSKHSLMNTWQLMLDIV